MNKTIKTIYIVFIFLTMLPCVSVFAHQDTIIELRNRELIGLPEKYQPAYLDLKVKTLQLGVNRIEFPLCMSKYFPENNDYEIQLTSSWYHDLSLLPPYLNIFIRPKGKEYSFNLIFLMDTLEPYKFEIQIRISELLTSFYELKISDSCLKSIQSSRTRIKP